jgi:hypothetical protein
MGFYVKNSSFGSWPTIKKFYVKTSNYGSWSVVKKAYIKAANGWAQFWPSAGPTPEYEVDLDISKNSYPASGTSYPVLTGTNYHWSSKSTVSLSYVFQSAPSPTGPWTNIKTGSYIANAPAGSVPWIGGVTVTYTPAFSDYSAGSTYFNFQVTASDGTSLRQSNSYTQYDRIITLPAPIWTTTVPRVNGLFGTGKIITWNTGKATIQGSSSSVGYYTTIWKISPTNVVTYLYGTSTAPDFQSTDDYQYTISIPSGDSGYTYYFTTYSAQSLITNPVQSTSYSYNQTVISSPAIVTNPSVTKYDGYQTVGYRLQGNTGTWNQTMDNYYYGWQYCNTNSSTVTDWKLMYTYSYNPITGSTWTPYNGTDTVENQNHILYIPLYTYAYGSTTPIPLAGKYINFYSNADKNYITAPLPPLRVVGPIYNQPGIPTSFTAYKGNSYNSSYSYVNFYWTDPASLSGTSTWYKYTVQYNNGGTWTDLGSTYSSTGGGTFASPLNLLVPVGTWDFRVKNENQEGLAAYSNTYNLQVVSAYNFAFGNVLYPNTNGQIGLDAGSLSVTIPSSGRVLAIYGLDLSQQTTGYWSDSRYFYIQFSGYQYQNVGVPTYALRYQVKFDTLNPNYADILICNKGSSLSQPTYIGIYSNGSLYAGVQGPFVLSTNSSYRIYFDGTTGYTGGSSSFTQIPSADFVAISLTAGTADDGYTSITTAANQYTPSYFSNVSGSVASNTLSVSFTGNIDYSYYYYRLDTGSYYGTNFANATGGTANPLTVSGLTPGTRYYLTFIPYNSQGQTGTAYQNYYDVPNAPSAFTTISGTKAYPTGATQSASEPTQSRVLSTSWNASTNATYYEVQYEGSADNSTWTVLQSLAGAPYLTSTSDTYTAAYYRYYRYSVRARDAAKTLNTAAYSDSGGVGALQYRSMTGTAPTAPTIGTITKTDITASIPFTINSGGSNTVDWIQYSTDQSNWSNTYTSPLSLSSLSGGTSYTYYFRALNYDGLYSSNSIASFTTNATSHTVTFNNNGGSGTMVAQTANTSTALTANSFTRTDYTFTGWNTAANGSGTAYADKASYAFTSDTTLYAQWSTYTVTFKANGGTGSDYTEIGVSTKALTSNSFTRSGYTFASWNTATNGTGTSYSNTANYAFTSDVTLYAQWTYIPPAPTINSNPTISGTFTAGGTITASNGSYSNATIQGTGIAYTSISASSYSTGTLYTLAPLSTHSTPYTVTGTDAASPAYYFYPYNTILGTNGTTYYVFGSSGLSSEPTINAPTITHTAGQNLYSFSGSSSSNSFGTVTYYWATSNSSTTAFTAANSSNAPAGTTSDWSGGTLVAAGAGSSVSTGRVTGRYVHAVAVLSTSPGTYYVRSSVTHLSES